MENTQHVCGSQGFGRSIYDECPACTEWRSERYIAAKARILAALKDLETQLDIARRANCTVSDVKRTLEEKLPNEEK